MGKGKKKVRRRKKPYKNERSFFDRQSSV